MPVNSTSTNTEASSRERRMTFHMAQLPTKAHCDRGGESLARMIPGRLAAKRLRARGSGQLCPLTHLCFDRPRSEPGECPPAAALRQAVHGEGCALFQVVVGGFMSKHGREHPAR